MDGQLVQVCRPVGSSWELMILVGTLRQEVAELRAEVHRLQRENLELRQQAAYWKSRHRDALHRITEMEQKVEQLEGEKRQLQADLFGRRSETTSRSDRSNDLDDPQDDSRKLQRKRGQQPENRGPKRRDYSHLPVREKALNSRSVSSIEITYFCSLACRRTFTGLSARTEREMVHPTKARSATSWRKVPTRIINSEE